MPIACVTSKPLISLGHVNLLPDFSLTCPAHVYDLPTLMPIFPEVPNNGLEGALTFTNHLMENSEEIVNTATL